MSSTEPCILSLIVPVKNEAGNIVSLVEEISDRVNIPHRIYVVYDSDDDDTLSQRDTLLALDSNVEFVKNNLGQGVINAFKTGFALADSPFIAPIMADMSDTPDTLNAMYKKITEGYDLVVGSRYAPGGKKIGGSRLKYVLSYLANNLLYKISSIPTHDLTNAFVMYRKEVLDEIHIRSTGGFEVTMEIIAKSHILGYKVTEVPTVNRERNSGQSKFRLIHWLAKYLYWFSYIVIFSAVRSLDNHYQRDSRSQLEGKTNANRKQDR